MPKIKRSRRKLTNGFHDRHGVELDLRHGDRGSIGYVKCSAQLFPHLVYVCELTTDFVDRAVGSIKLPKTWSSLNIMNKKFHVIIESKSLPIHSVNNNQDFSEAEKWPQSPIIYIWEKEHIQIDNEVLLMSRATFNKTIKMLDQSYLDSKKIRSAITHADVREVHEALTEMLETPIWEFLNEIKATSQLPVSEVLSMELDILLNTVKHSSSKLSHAKDQLVTVIPPNLKDYLSRKREVSGFGIWNQKEFRVFLQGENKADQGRHIQSNLLRMYTKFFENFTLKVVSCNAQFLPYVSQGDKLVPESGNGYSTLGGFVKDNRTPHVYAVTCSHGVPEASIVSTGLENSDRDRIGTCIFSSYFRPSPDQHIPILSDVALIQIDDQVRNMCHLSLTNHKYEDSKVRIYDGNFEDFVVRHVYKIGATTSLRKGLIISPDFTATISGNRLEVFVVVGMGGLPFAEGGDSGSIVFMNENNSALDTIQVIGMVCGNMQIRKNEYHENQTESDSINAKKKDEENQTEKVCCYRFNATMEILRQNGFDVSFENQV